MDNLVTVDWLARHLGDADLVVIDCTNRARFSPERNRFVTQSDRAGWIEGHIPGARHADFTTPGWTGEASRYRNTLPEPRAFADALERLGVSDESRVVLYDRESALWAARVWWMLRWIGFDRAAVLDGGWQEWRRAGGQAETGEGVPPVPGRLNLRLRPGLFTGFEKMLDAVREGNAQIVDGLSADQHAGRVGELGLSGHIPGAVNVPGAEMVNAATGRFLPLEQLGARIPGTRDRRTIIYCGSGIAAASVAFVMQRLGYGNLTIYMPGLQEWVERSGAPLVTGVGQGDESTPESPPIHD